MKDTTRSLVARAIGDDVKLGAIFALMEDLHEAELELAIHRAEEPIPYEVTAAPPPVVAPEPWRPGNIWSEWSRKNLQPFAPPCPAAVEERTSSEVEELVDKVLEEQSTEAAEKDAAEEEWLTRIPVVESPPEEKQKEAQPDQPSPEVTTAAKAYAQHLIDTGQALPRESAQEPGPEVAPVSRKVAPATADELVFEYLDKDALLLEFPELRPATVGARLYHLGERVKGIEAQSIIAAIEAVREGLDQASVRSRLTPIQAPSIVNALMPFLKFWAARLDTLSPMQERQVKEELPAKLVKLGALPPKGGKR